LSDWRDQLSNTLRSRFIIDQFLARLYLWTWGCEGLHIVSFATTWAGKMSYFQPEWKTIIMNYDSVANSNTDDFQPYPGWQFRFVCDGYVVFYDPTEQLYHSIIPIACPASLYQEQFYEPGSSARFISLVEVVVRLFRRIRASRIARYVNSGGGV